jgi:K(+)-stimulated pyrophosphate-energized sodium pump
LRLLDEVALRASRGRHPRDILGRRTNVGGQRRWQTELNAKGTELHASAVVGDTVGDPFKDTSSVAMNPIIKFTTLFGLLAVELAVTLQNGGLKGALAAAFLMVAFVFVYRSFYGMRIPVDAKTETKE